MRVGDFLNALQSLNASHQINPIHPAPDTDSAKSIRVGDSAILTRNRRIWPPKGRFPSLAGQILRCAQDDQRSARIHPNPYEGLPTLHWQRHRKIYSESGFLGPLATFLILCWGAYEDFLATCKWGCLRSRERFLRARRGRGRTSEPRQSRGPQRVQLPLWPRRLAGEGHHPTETAPDQPGPAAVRAGQASAGVGYESSDVRRLRGSFPFVVTP